MDFLYDFLAPFFRDATVLFLRGVCFADKCVGNTFYLADGRSGMITLDCSGAGLFISLVIIAILRFRPRKVNFIMLAATPIVAVVFNAIRCMLIIGRGITIHDIGGFAIFAVPVLFYALVDYKVLSKPFAKMAAMLMVGAFCTWRATPAYANGVKEDTNVVDVVNIKLREVVASSKDVKLQWEVSDNDNSRTIHVLYRDKTHDGMWIELATLSGVTNAAINGFFIDRDTEWKVNTQGENYAK
jgi:hypothetical protein